MHRLPGKPAAPSSRPPPSFPRLGSFLTKRMQAVLLLLKGVAEFGDSYFTTVLTEICKLSGVSTYSSLSRDTYLAQVTAS